MRFREQVWFEKGEEEKCGKAVSSCGSLALKVATRVTKKMRLQISESTPKLSPHTFYYTFCRCGALYTMPRPHTP
jgi:hypothetical protein